LKIAPINSEGLTLNSALARASFQPVFPKRLSNFKRDKIWAIIFPMAIAINQPIIKIITAAKKAGIKTKNLSHML